MKKFTLIDKNTNKVFVKDVGLYELSRALNRSVSSVCGTIWRIEKGKLKSIRNYDGDYFTLVIDYK